MISPPARNFLNSTFVNVTSLRDVEGEPAIELHAADAFARGIAHEQMVRVFNDRGACLAREAAVRVDDDATGLVPGRLRGVVGDGSEAVVVLEPVEAEQEIVVTATEGEGDDGRMTVELVAQQEDRQIVKNAVAELEPRQTSS